jgi:bifunctional DNA-binding transcriptional regulator/antitoxin component of YhaV-PrlF toxin-antitoxin module
MVTRLATRYPQGIRWYPVERGVLRRLAVTVATTTLGERGLLRLPASVRDRAGVDKGDELIVIAAGPGRIVLTTRTAIQDEVWSAAPAAGTIVSVRADRDADNAAVAGKRRRMKVQMAATTEEESEHVGSSLLTQFGA